MAIADLFPPWTTSERLEDYVPDDDAAGSDEEWTPTGVVSASS